jgi:hypothetical protein
MRNSNNKNKRDNKSKRQVINFDTITEGVKIEKIDTSKVIARLRKSKKEEQKLKAEKRALEEERIRNIKCPVCKSKKKSHFVDRVSNGVYGRGHNSYVKNEYLICENCGVHYSDLKKMKE